MSRNTTLIRVSKDLYMRLKAHTSSVVSIGDVLDTRFNQEDEEIRERIARLERKMDLLIRLST